jgi:predicted amidohydrolase YtcJ
VCCNDSFSGAQTLGMNSKIGSAADMMKQLRSAGLTESQGAFMKRNVFQEEMKLLKRSYTEGRLSVDVMAALKEDAEEEPKTPRGEGEPFDELALVEDDLAHEERRMIRKLLDDDNDKPQAQTSPAPKNTDLVGRADLERVYSRLLEKAKVCNMPALPRTCERAPH